MDQHLIQLYCIANQLQFATFAELAAVWGGEDEWEGVVCAGIDEMGTPLILVETTGEIKVVTAFADGRRHMYDEWTVVTEVQVMSGRRLHSV